MKKIFFIFFIFISTIELYSLTLEDQYKKGLFFYQNKNFKSSYEIFSNLYLTYLSDAKLNFYLGRSAYETKHYEIALASFQRVEMLEPNNLRNRVEIARTYYILGMYEDAKEIFYDVLYSTNLPKNVKKNINIYLSKIEQNSKKSFTSFGLNLGFIYDSNVNYASIENSYETTLGRLISSSRKSDTAMKLSSDLINIYDVGDKDGFLIKNSISVLIKKYKIENDYDLKYISYTPSLIFSQINYVFDFRVGTDMLYISNYHYLDTYFLMPQYIYRHTKNLKSKFYFKYQKKSFKRDIDKDLDSNHYEISYQLSGLLYSSSITSSCIALRETKVSGNRIDVDYDEVRFNLQYFKNIRIVNLNLLAELKKKKYADFSNIFNSKRDDDGVKFSVGFSRVLNGINIYANTTYLKVNSNQEKYSYKKYVIDFGLSKRF